VPEEAGLTTLEFCPHC